MGVNLRPARTINREIAHLPGVKVVVREHADKIGDKAARLLAEHHDTGNASIDVSSGRVDSYVTLSDPGGNALSIEFGHWNVRANSYTEGLYILTRALHNR